MTGALQNYESLSTLMGLMQEAAAQGQWDRLTELEKQCQERVAVMRQVDPQAPLDAAQRARKKALILKMLADDAAIRHHTQPWMQKVEALLQTNRREQQVRRAYAPG